MMQNDVSSPSPSPSPSPSLSPSPGYAAYPNPNQYQPYAAPQNAPPPYNPGSATGYQPAPPKY